MSCKEASGSSLLLRVWTFTVRTGIETDIGRVQSTFGPRVIMGAIQMRVMPKQCTRRSLSFVIAETLSKCQVIKCSKASDVELVASNGKKLRAILV